jgi:hypothetical protein
MSSFRKSVPFKGKKNNSCVILGNGPSISDDLEKIMKFVEGKDVFCVNDFCKTKHFAEIKPKNYVLLEPTFWSKTLPEKVRMLRDETYSSIIEKTKWQLNLYLPFEVEKSKVLEDFPFQSNNNVKIVFFNRTSIPLNSLGATYFYKRGLGMPKPHNVLVATIFLAINCGFSPIFMFGADHSWHENLHVGDDNILYVKQIRFHDTQFNPIYKSAEASGEAFKVHEIFYVWSKVFAAYHQLNSYANQLNIKIVNASSKSYIDAFTRQVLKPTK